MLIDTKENSVAGAKRRRYEAAFKRAVVNQTLVAGASVARVARGHGINANQVFKWRRQQLLAERTRSGGSATPASVSLVPVSVINEERCAPEVAVASPAREGTIEITLGAAQVRVSGVVDEATLACVLTSLRQ